MAPVVATAVDLEALHALRTRAVFSRGRRPAVLMVRGRAAFDVLDRLLPSDLFIRNRRARHSLLLDDGGHIVADLTLLADGDDYLVVADGAEAAVVASAIRAAILPTEAVEVEVLANHTRVLVTGPYSWQPGVAICGPGSEGLRYLSWIPLDHGVRCLRAGHTGEFSWWFVGPEGAVDDVANRLRTHGEAVNMVEASAEVLEVARLQAWVYDVYRAPGACPLEWGLHARLMPDKAYRGAQALQTRAPAARRVVAFEADTPIAAGSPVTAFDHTIGEVAAAVTLGTRTIGVALVASRYAHAGIDAYRAADTPLRTLSPPFVRFQSMMVTPGRNPWSP